MNALTLIQATVEPVNPNSFAPVVRALRSFVPGFEETKVQAVGVTQYKSSLPIVIQFVNHDLRQDGLTTKFGGSYAVLACAQYAAAPSRSATRGTKSSASSW